MAYWILAAHPANFRVLDSVLERDEEWWRTGDRSLAKGDRVAIWKYKGREAKRGVVGLGEVLTDPEVMDQPDEPDRFWLGGGRELPPIAARVRVLYVRPAHLPIWYGEDPSSVVNELSVSRAQGGTAFHITDEQWNRLLTEVGGWPASGDVTSASTTEAINDVVRGRRRGQGIGLTAPERQAVDRRAMAVAEEEFTRRGWTVTDVSRGASYDLLCERGDDYRHVEVKGTTGLPTTVFLTRNEVITARADPDRAILAVIHGILLSGPVHERVASEGALLVFDSWNPSDDDLTPPCIDTWFRRSGSSTSTTELQLRQVLSAYIWRGELRDLESEASAGTPSVHLVKQKLR